MSFSGVYQHAIDAKGRTSLPSKFRDVLSAQGAEKLIVTTDILDPCLQAYAPAQWTAFTDKVKNLSQFHTQVRLLLRNFVAPAQECAVDRLGRVLIPPQLREFAALTDEITWAGTGDRIEIWKPAHWIEEQRKARKPEVMAKLAEQLSQLL